MIVCCWVKLGWVGLGLVELGWVRLELDLDLGIGSEIERTLVRMLSW